MTTPQQMALAHEHRDTVEDVAKHGGRCKVVCKDGFTMSVIAHFAAYCTPRPGWPEALGGASDDNYSGPFTELEVGYPSVKPQPWVKWQRYADNEDHPTESVYSYVPLADIQRLITKHGGYA